MEAEAGDPSAPLSFHSRRLRSLWDMYEFEVSRLHEATAIIQQTAALARGIPPDDVMSATNKNASIGMLERLETVIDPLPVPVSKITASDLRDLLSNDPKLTYFACAQLYLNLSETLRRELRTVKTFALDANEMAHYEPKEPLFGREVADKFKSGAYDITEAGKCLALGRSTAAVFHLMHVVEIALKAIHGCLGLTAPDNPSWGIWLKQIRDDRVRRGDRKWPENDYFQDVYSRLDAIKDAQRDPTLHVQTIHTEDEADLIFRNTKALMKKIACRMDENGEPKA
jgi:hypothetical protein